MHSGIQLLLFLYFMKHPCKRRFDGIDRPMNSSDSVCRISASGETLKDTLLIAASFHLDVGSVRARSQRLHVGANDITNPADFGVVVDSVDAGLFLVKTILQGFDCDIEADFVPKFETVGDGLRG